MFDTPTRTKSPRITENRVLDKERQSRQVLRATCEKHQCVDCVRCLVKKHDP